MTARNLGPLRCLGPAVALLLCGTTPNDPAATSRFDYFRVDTP